jgi:hypothetical protein
MNTSIVGLFISPIVLTIFPMTVIVKYINNKAIVKRNIQDQIQVDLAVVTLVYVYLYSSMFIAREIFGPLEYLTLLNIALWILQCVFNMGFNCIISLELIQFANIFSLTIFSDWPESRCLKLHRILVFPFGFIIGSVLCSVGAGSCRKSPIYNYFIIESLQTDVVKTSLLSGISWIIYGIIILTCQVSVEVKRFSLNRADQRADNLALNAKRQLQQAVTMLKIKNPVELGIQNLLINNNPKPFEPFQVSVVTKTTNKVISDPESTKNIIGCQKSPSCKKPTHYNQEDLDKELSDVQTLSSIEEDVLSAVDNLAKESHIQTVSQTLFNTASKHQYGNDRIPRSFLGHNRSSFQAWEKNVTLELDETESIQAQCFVDSHNQTSRDQVMTDHII